MIDFAASTNILDLLICMALGTDMQSMLKSLQSYEGLSLISSSLSPPAVAATDGSQSGMDKAFLSCEPSFDQEVSPTQRVEVGDVQKLWLQVGGMTCRFVSVALQGFVV